MKKLNSLILSTITAGFLVGCGGGSSESSSGSSITGTLIDNIVSGVKYINGSTTGYTDGNGKFPYTSGLVEFYLGGIKIGELNSMTSDSKVFIQDLVGVERTNTTDVKLLKIAKLLQSLDSDPLTDEIEILKSDFDKFESSTQSIDTLDIDTILTNNGFTPQSDVDVKIHIENSLKQFGEISDTTPPSLVSSSIVNGTTGVSITPSIVLTFSETIPKEYLTNKYFILTNDLDSSNVELNIEVKDKVITITPKNNLDYSQSYEFVISSKLKDFAGNELSNEGGNTDILIEFLVQEEIDVTAPAITSGSSVSVNENQTSVMTVSSTDNSPVTYSLAGTDATSFNINSVTGEITFKIAPDYEVKNSYVTTATVTDSSNNYVSQNITVNINDVYEADVTYPVFISNSNVSVDENQILALTAAASDNSAITYALSGVDQSSFTLDTTSGVITFKVGPDYEIKNSYAITIAAIDSSNNTTYLNVTITINDVYEYVNQAPIVKAGNDKKIYITEDITLDASASSDNSGIASYEWSEGATLLSDQVSFIKSDFSVGTHNITLTVTDDENETSTDNIVVTVFDIFTNILPMSEVGGSKSISSSTIGTTTTTTLAAGSQLYFKITNDIDRNFTVSEFKIVSYYNNYPTTRASSTDSSLLSNGTLDAGESISLGYALTSNQQANYWLGTYTLTDVNTKENFTNSFIWNGTKY